MKKIELTADWILERFSCGKYADGRGNGTLIILEDELTNYFFIELAFEQMGIEYEANDYSDDNGENVETHFEFEIEDIKEDCPKLYKSLSELNYNNSIAGRRKKKLEALKNK